MPELTEREKLIVAKQPLPLDDLRRCESCGEEKSERDFTTKRGKPVASSWCRFCRANHGQAFRQNRDRLMMAAVAAHANRGKSRKRIVIESLLNDARQQGCAVCKVNDPLLIDLHHYNADEKEFELSIKSFHRPIEAIRAELDKCLPLCAHHHRMLHAGRPEIVEAVDAAWLERHTTTLP